MRGLSLDQCDHRTALSAAEVIQELLACKATFAAFKVPGRDTIVQVQHDQVLHAPRTGEGAFVIAPFKGDAVCIRPDIELSTASERSSLEGMAIRYEMPATPLAGTRGLDRNGYRTAVERAVAAIKTGPLEKVVLSRTMEVDLARIDIGGLYSAAALSMPDACIALIHTAEHGTWIGASPERLLVMHGDHVQVDALAGTMPSMTGMTMAAWGAKEREEQELVARSVLQTMHEQGVLDQKTDGPATVIAGRVAHLRTRITGRSLKEDPLALANALHPTPAVGGTPRTEAMRLIHALEPRDRSLYAGFWGPMDGHGAEFFVNIRCMQVIGTVGVLHVGAGITAGSDPDRECDEVELKARTWLDLIEAQRRTG